MNFIALSSSRGTTFQAVIDAMQEGALRAKCIGLVTDNEKRECIAKAEAAGIPVRAVTGKKKPREQYDAAVDAAIRDLASETGVPEPDVIAEMGWMWIHTPSFIQKWPRKILNVHPALLPKYGGKGMYGSHVHEAVLAAGESESGVTIHVMDEGVDTGTIIEQKMCSVEEGETAESLQAKVQLLERELYPEVLQGVEEGRIVLS